MTTMVEMMSALHQSLQAAGVAHGFGGALALAFCIEEARGTQDIDLNVFVEADAADRVFAVLPTAVEVTDKNRAEIARDGQSRLHWGDVPVDVFFSTTPFHAAAATRVRWEEIGGGDLPFLDCSDLAVFKAFFNRSRDWLDLAVMLHSGTLDLDRVLGVLAEYLGGDDERIQHLRNLEPEPWS